MSPMPNGKTSGGGKRTAMPLRPALDVIRKLRGDAIVITTMGAAREWPQLYAAGAVLPSHRADTMLHRIQACR